MYGVALLGLFVFLQADFAMMSSLCFIWKSILECLQMQPPLSSHFHIVFHSEPVRVYTETHVDWYGSAAAIEEGGKMLVYRTL